MTPIEHARTMLSAYMQAEASVLTGQSVTFQGRSVSHSNLAEIRAGRQEWERKLAELENPAYNTIGGLRFKVASFGQR